MTVAQNIEFGLRVRKVPMDQRQRRRDELLELVGLVGLGNRMTAQLSGGQQQRVAWQEPWPLNRTSCCWMNLSVHWIPKLGWNCVEVLRKFNGN